MSEQTPPEAGPATAPAQDGQNSPHDGHNEDEHSNKTSATTLPKFNDEEWTYEKQLKVRNLPGSH